MPQASVDRLSVPVPVPGDLHGARVKMFDPSIKRVKRVKWPKINVYGANLK